MARQDKLILLNDTGKDIRDAILKSSTFIADKLKEKNIKEDSIIYGFHINSNESNPYNAVTYLEDAVGKTPAYMDFTNDKFEYGSWENAFFMPRPCMLKYDGTVDYYLDPNDYEKKDADIINEPPYIIIPISALGDSSLGYGVKYSGNAMMEWGRDGKKIWTKVVPDSSNPNSGSVYISNKQIDEDYTCYPFINNQGRYVDHFYTAIYNGSLTAYTYNSTVYYRLRSIPRRPTLNSKNDNTSYTIPWEDDSTGTPEGFGCTDVQNEINLSLNNNPLLNKNIDDELTLTTDRANIGWFTEVFCDIQLINNLLILIGKSLDTQSVFGNGNIDSYVNDGHGHYDYGVLYTASYYYGSDYYKLNKSGLFYGTSQGVGSYPTNAVKVFGMENWWGNQNRRYAGHISSIKFSENPMDIINTQLIKQTFGTNDGSNTIGYNLDGTDYIDTDIEVPISGDYIKDMKFINNKINSKINVFLPIQTGATSSTYWCDYYNAYINTTSNSYAYRGGTSNSGNQCGAFCISINGSTAYNYNWTFNACLSYKPIDQIN